MEKLRRTGLALLLSLTVLAAEARANGWEHGAVPFEALLAALRQESSEIRLKAVQSLGFRGQVEAVAPLLALLAKPDPSRHVRAAIAIALGRIGDRRALQPLIGCLQADRRPEVRADCAVGLGLLEAAEAVEPLLNALERDEAPLVRRRAVDALGAFGAPRAVEALIALLDAEDGLAALRGPAIRALGNSGAETALAPLLRLLERPRDAREHAQTVEALGRLGRPAAQAPLAALLERTEAPGLRLRIVIALSAIRDGSSLPALIERLEDPDVAVRYFAASGLRDIGDAAAAPALGALALRILDRFAGQSPAEQVADAEAGRAELSILEQALWALVELDPAASREIFLFAAWPRPLPADSSEALALNDAVYLARRVALRGLGYVGDLRARVVLEVIGLEDPDPRLRAVAVRAIAVAGGEGAAASLLPSLEDANADVRASAAQALGRLGDAAAVEPLIARLSDSVAEVRRQSLLALAYLGDARGLQPARERAAEDDSRIVRAAAAYAVDLLGRQAD